MFITNENMQTLTDILGNIYLSWESTFDSDISLGGYELKLQRIASFLNNDYIPYTVKQSTDLIVSKKSGSDNILTIGEGYLINSASEYVRVSEHDVYVDTLFTYNYDSDGHYGVLLGFYFDDIEASSEIVVTEIDADIGPGSAQQTLDKTRIPIKDTFAISSIDTPAYAHVDSEKILISSIDTVNKELIIDSNYNDNDQSPISSHSSGAGVFFYKSLFATPIYGPPVTSEHQSGGFASSFKYYPVIPDNYVLVAKVLVEKPLTPEKVSASTNDTNILDIYDARTIGDKSSSIPFTDDEKLMIFDFIGKMEQTKNIISFNQTLVDIINYLSQITFEDSTNQTSGSFSSYWNDRPVQRSVNYQYGPVFNDFERIEFSDGFKKLWYYAKEEQLLTTMGIFSGGLMDNAYGSFETVPEITSISSTQKSNSSDGGISPGVWSYAVTAISSNGESSLSTFESISIPTSKPYNTVTLRWENISGIEYYHVYRKNSNFSTLIDLRLTEESSVTFATHGVSVDGTDYIDFTDDGSYSGLSTKRGVILTEKTILDTSGTSLYVKVPVLDASGSLYGDDLYRLSEELTDPALVNPDPTSNTTQNGFILIMTLKKPDDTTEIIEQTIPKGTVAGTSFLINSGQDYVELIDMSVKLISNASQYTKIGSRINWSAQDTAFVQNIS